MRNSHVISFLYTSLSASEATYYVDPFGIDTNDGLSITHWETITCACSLVTNPWNIIYINVGTSYPWYYEKKIHNITFSSKHIT
jgi:hypothetical protein